MRFQVVSDPRARSASRRGLTRAAARGRTATVTAVAAAACGLVMTACGSQGSPAAASSATSSTSPGSPSAASADACATSQLKISIVDTGALAGQAGGYLKFTNDSHTACRMSDWPAVTGVTAAGKATRLRNLQSLLPGARSYLPSCPSAKGSPTAGASTITSLSSLPH
jgi:hypothetical protein